MSINLSYYDITQLDVANDSNDNGSIPQSGANSWLPLTPGFKSLKLTKAEKRLIVYGNSQVRTIDKSVKQWLEFDMSLSALKYDSTSPAFSYWDIVSQALYGGATGSPILRPGKMYLGVKLNRPTPEYWLGAGGVIDTFTLKGDMTQDELVIGLKGMCRMYQLNTTNYVQGTASRRIDPPKVPIIPAQDITWLINGVDVTNIMQTFTLTLSRKYQSRGRASTIASSGTQINVDGSIYREFTPDTFEGKLECKLDPYGTVTQQVLDYIADTGLATVEMKTQQTTGGKQIQFTASKYQKADQSHETQKTPSEIDLEIQSSTLNVNTL